MNVNSYNYITTHLSAPKLKIGDVQHNVQAIIKEINIHADSANILVFPELCLTSATCYDLFFSQELHHNVNNAIKEIITATADTNATIILGTPLYYMGNLYNVALFISAGRLLGIVPKHEENRYFSAPLPSMNSIVFEENAIPLSANLIFNCENFDYCNIAIHIGKPTIHAYSMLSSISANIVINIDAANFTINEYENIEHNIKYLSGLANQAIVYVNTNASESTTDYVFGSKLIIAETGKIIACANTLQLKTQNLISEIDLDVIKYNTISNKIINNYPYIIIKFSFILHNINYLHRTIDKNPYFCVDNLGFIAEDVDLKFCKKILEVQALGLARRLEHLKMSKIVIGISGGVDSTLALLVAITAFKILDLDKSDIVAISMPGLGTGNDTQSAAQELIKLTQVTHLNIPINKAVELHFDDINHDIENTNIVYENTQARQRTMTLFNYANKVGGLVLGTGDMSEIALGWSTYNGDHMSNYNVNAGVPKTIAQMILRTFAEKDNIYSNIAHVLLKIIHFPVSPELIPSKTNDFEQKTEDIIGPYVLHDFYMYYHLKYHLSKKKIAFLAHNAFSEQYTEENILKYMDIFFCRFYANQYKRSCSTDGPNIFDFSLSPRIGLKLSSDVEFI